MNEIDNWTNQVHRGDSLELLKELPEESVDLVLTDPPYNLSKGQEDIDLGGGEKRTQNYGEWDEGETRPSDWVRMADRTLKSERWFISFYDAKKMHELRFALEESGYEFFTKNYWVKTNPAPLIRVKTMIPGVEEMWVASKGGGGTAYFNEELKQRNGAIEAPLVGNHEYREHPTQKPVEVIQTLIEYYCPPDGVVLDPFLGSGTTAVAAEKAERDWVGVELEEEYAEMAKDRLRSEVLWGADDAMEEDW